MKRIRVSAAVIKDGDKILATERGYGEYKGLWEFPGGKVEPGEDDREALVREIGEEMDWAVTPTELLATVDYDYPDFSLRLVAYLCHAPADDNFKLLEHIDYKWLTKDGLPSLQWTAADAELIRRAIS